MAAYRDTARSVSISIIAPLMRAHSSRKESTWVVMTSTRALPMPTTSNEWLEGTWERYPPSAATAPKDRPKKGARPSLTSTGDSRRPVPPAAFRRSSPLRDRAGTGFGGGHFYGVGRHRARYGGAGH